MVVQIGIIYSSVIIFRKLASLSIKIRKWFISNVVKEKELSDAR